MHLIVAKTVYSILIVCLFVSVNNGLPLLLSSSNLKNAHICIVTAYRDKVSYVQQTTAALNHQLKKNANFTMSVIIVISDDDHHRSSNSAYYEKAFKLPNASPLHSRQKTNGPDCETGEDTDPLPPCKVRQQALDVVGALEQCYFSDMLSEWFVLMEDDFEPCANTTLKELWQALQKQQTSNVKFVRFTQGGGGVAFPRASVLPYVNFVREHNREFPHDRMLTMTEWSALPDVVLPIHLFKHIGKVSTIAYRNSADYIRDYASIRDNECGEPIHV